MLIPQLPLVISMLSCMFDELLAQLLLEIKQSCSRK